MRFGRTGGRGSDPEAMLALPDLRRNLSPIAVSTRHGGHGGWSGPNPMRDGLREDRAQREGGGSLDPTRHSGAEGLARGWHTLRAGPASGVGTDCRRASRIRYLAAHAFGEQRPSCIRHSARAVAPAARLREPCSDRRSVSGPLRRKLYPMLSGISGRANANGRTGGSGGGAIWPMRNGRTSNSPLKLCRHGTTNTGRRKPANRSILMIWYAG